jgi:hypothetical protein
MMSLIKNLNFEKENLYTYRGSLTTPPCSEIVTWFVVNQPQQISREQVSQINSLYRNNTKFAGGRGNNRLPQPLNERYIYLKGRFELDRMDPEVYMVASTSTLKHITSAIALGMMVFAFLA